MAAKKMNAAVVEHFGKPLVLREWDIPTPGVGQIVVKTEACGVCHTDLHAADGVSVPLPRWSVRSCKPWPTAPGSIRGSGRGADPLGRSRWASDPVLVLLAERA